MSQTTMKSSSVRPYGKSKYAKRRNANKRNSPVATKSGPVKEYISACCSAPARKPALVKQSTDKKSKEVPKGLGHWRCSICGKPTKVTPRRPETKAEPVPANNVAVSVEAPSEHI